METELSQLKQQLEELKQSNIAFSELLQKKSEIPTNFIPTQMATDSAQDEPIINQLKSNIDSLNAEKTQLLAELHNLTGRFQETNSELQYLKQFVNNCVQLQVNTNMQNVMQIVNNPTRNSTQTGKYITTCTTFVISLHY